MIPLEKEVAIHEALLETGLFQRAIAIKYDVSISTVERVNRSIRDAKKLSKRERSRARLLLSEGLSPGAIATRLSVPQEAVFGLRRSEFLKRSHVDSPFPCPTCGGVMLPDVDGEDYEIPAVPEYISQKHAKALYEMSSDVIGLAMANTIRNLLFYNIANLAENLHKKIGESNGEKETEEPERAAQQTEE